MSERFWWKARLVRDGPWVGIVTWFGAPVIDGEEQDRSHSWQCMIRTETTSRLILFGDNCPIEVDGISLRNIERIDEPTYRYMIDTAKYATAYRPDMPAAAPTTAIDWNRRRPIF